MATFTMFKMAATNFLGGNAGGDAGMTDWLTHDVRATLHTSTWVPNTATNEVKADATNELTTANGYTALGQSLTTKSVDDSGATKKFICADFSWTASGGSIGPFRYCAIWNDTPTTPADPLIGYIDVGGDTTITTGNTITFDCDQVNGLFTGTAT
jgi:hypothetical protein